MTRVRQSVRSGSPGEQSDNRLLIFIGEDGDLNDAPTDDDADEHGGCKSGADIRQKRMSLSRLSTT